MLQMSHGRFYIKSGVIFTGESIPGASDPFDLGWNIYRARPFFCAFIDHMLQKVGNPVVLPPFISAAGTYQYQYRHRRHLRHGKSEKAKFVGKSVDGVFHLGDLSYLGNLGIDSHSTKYFGKGQVAVHRIEG